MFPPGDQGHWRVGGGTQRLVLEGGWECVNGSFQLRPVKKIICNSMDKCHLSILHMTGSWPTCLIHVPPRLSFLP